MSIELGDLGASGIGVRGLRYAALLAGHRVLVRAYQAPQVQGDSSDEQ
jgi:hypothetical protein